MDRSSVAHPAHVVAFVAIFATLLALLVFFAWDYSTRTRCTELCAPQSPTLPFELCTRHCLGR